MLALCVVLAADWFDIAKWGMLINWPHRTWCLEAKYLAKHLTKQIKSDSRLLTSYQDEMVRLCLEFGRCSLSLVDFGLTFVSLPLKQLTDDDLDNIVKSWWWDIDAGLYDHADTLRLYQRILHIAIIHGDADDDDDLWEMGGAHRMELLESIPEPVWSNIMSKEQCEWVLRNPGSLYDADSNTYRSYLHYLVSLLRYATMLGHARRFEIICEALPDTDWKDVEDCFTLD